MTDTYNFGNSRLHTPILEIDTTETYNCKYSNDCLPIFINL